MSEAAKAMREAPREPTEEMLIAARDWSDVFAGRPIGNRAAIGCWQAMFDAIPAEPRPDPVATLREKIKAEIARTEGSWRLDGLYRSTRIVALEWVLSLMAELGDDAAEGGYCGNPPHVGNPGLVTGHATPVQFGCICPGDATPYCRNPLCPRKGPPDPLAPVERHSIP